MRPKAIRKGLSSTGFTRSSLSKALFSGFIPEVLLFLLPARPLIRHAGPELVPCDPDAGCQAPWCERFSRRASSRIGPSAER